MDCVALAPSLDLAGLPPMDVSGGLRGIAVRRPVDAVMLIEELVRH